MRNKDLRPVCTGFVLLALALSTPAWAQNGAEFAPMPDTYDAPIPARVRHFEGTVTIQRATAGETSEALVNLPLEAGDRIWTAAGGRAEIVLSDGSTVWLDSETTLDVVSLPYESEGQTILRAWSGALIVFRPQPYEDIRAAHLRIDGASASVELRHAGEYRVDIVDGRDVWVSVLDGSATVAAGGITELVGPGERTAAQAGRSPAQAVAFNTAELDDFARWQGNRLLGYAEAERYVAQREYVPARVRPYAAELDASGSWFYYDDFDSWAWRPRVATSWAPYRHGRWVYAYGGWSWVSSASWGWATAHYGRWHHLPAQGWVWFPGHHYAPAWVSWHLGSGSIAWSPIGYYNRPFLSINLFFGGHRGYGPGYHGRHHYDYRGYDRYDDRGRGGAVVADRGYARNAEDYGWTTTTTRDFGRLPQNRTLERTAVARTPTNTVSFQGPLRNRTPTDLVAPRIATPRATASPGPATPIRITPRDVGRTPAPGGLTRSLPRATPRAVPGGSPAAPRSPYVRDAAPLPERARTPDAGTPRTPTRSIVPGVPSTPRTVVPPRASAPRVPVDRYGATPRPPSSVGRVPVSTGRVPVPNTAGRPPIRSVGVPRPPASIPSRAGVRPAPRSPSGGSVRRPPSSGSVRRPPSTPSRSAGKAKPRGGKPRGGKPRGGF